MLWRGATTVNGTDIGGFDAPGLLPPTIQFPPGSLQTIISVHCRRLVKFWTNIFETDERDFQIKAIVVD